MTYEDLAKDLYRFQFENDTDQVRLKWGQDFYRFVGTKDRGEEEKDEK